MLIQDFARVPQLKALGGVPIPLAPKTRIRVLAVAPTYPYGPDNYQLKGPIADVLYLNSLVQSQDLPFIAFTMLCGHDATVKNILDRLGMLLRQCRGGDVLVLYLAGHGYQTWHSGYAFGTYDANEHRWSPIWLTYRRILQTIKRNIPPDVFVIQIRDTCAASPSPAEEQEIMLDVRLSSSTVVLAACEIEEESFEFDKQTPHSVFLHQLIKAWSHRSLVGIGRMISLMLARIHTQGKAQTPRLKPQQNRSKLAEIVARLANGLRGFGGSFPNHMPLM